MTCTTPKLVVPRMAESQMTEAFFPKNYGRKTGFSVHGRLPYSANWNSAMYFSANWNSAITIITPKLGLFLLFSEKGTRPKWTIYVSLSQTLKKNGIL